RGGGGEPARTRAERSWLDGRATSRTRATPKRRGRGFPRCVPARSARTEAKRKDATEKHSPGQRPVGAQSRPDKDTVCVCRWAGCSAGHLSRRLLVIANRDEARASCEA